MLPGPLPYEYIFTTLLAALPEGILAALIEIQEQGRGQMDEEPSQALRPLQAKVAALLPG